MRTLEIGFYDRQELKIKDYMCHRVNGPFLEIEDQDRYLFIYQVTDVEFIMITNEESE